MAQKKLWSSHRQGCFSPHNGGGVFILQNTQIPWGAWKEKSASYFSRETKKLLKTPGRVPGTIKREIYYQKKRNIWGEPNLIKEFWGAQKTLLKPEKKS